MKIVKESGSCLTPIPLCISFLEGNFDRGFLTNLGLVLPCLVLLIVLFLGHFTAHTSGAKELCMAQFASKSRRKLKAIPGLRYDRLALSHDQPPQGDERTKPSRACHCSLQH